MWSGIRVFALMVVPSCAALMMGLAYGRKQDDRRVAALLKREEDLKRQLARQAEFVRARDPLVTATDQPLLDRLQAHLDSAVGEALRFSNKVARVEADAATAQKEAAKALEDSKAEILERSKRIEVLEGELGALNQQVRDLAERMARQNQRVAEAERLLATAAGDREAMRKNLDALLAERSEIESRLKAKEATLSALKKTRDDEYAARESVVRRGVGWRVFRKAPEKEEPPVAKAPVRQVVVASGVEVSVAESPRARAHRGSSGKSPAADRAAKGEGKTGVVESPRTPMGGR